MRKGDLELRKSSGKNNYFEIVKWHENPYFGMEHLYNKIGDFYHEKDNRYGYSIHESCFANPESCYVIMFIKDGVVDFIGNRALELPFDILVDFLFLMRSGINKSLRYKVK